MLEMQVCGLLAAIELVEKGGRAAPWSPSDVLAIALWLAFDFLPPTAEPKIEALRANAIAASRSRVIKTGLESRERALVPEIGEFGNDVLSKDAFSTALAPVISALRTNASLDREELDLLWWSMGNRSTIFDTTLDLLPIVTRALTTGVELGNLMRRLPSQSHRNLAMRNVGEWDWLTLEELLVALGDDRYALSASSHDETLVDASPGVFPLLYAFRNGGSQVNGGRQARSLTDWTARALLESAVIHIQYVANTSR